MIRQYLRLALAAIAMLAIAFPSSGFACSMTSNPEVTIALGDPAPHEIDSDEILEGTPSCPGPYVVTVFNPNGSMRLNPIVDCDDVGKRLLVKVTATNGNSVWSYVTIEDNLKPVVTAANITVTCVDDVEAAANAAITATDNCTATADLEFRITSIPTAVGCSNGIAQTFIRSIFVIDEEGNRSATVPQTITVTRVDIADVMFPANITYLTSDTTICPGDFGSPAIQFPTVNGMPISATCKLLTTVEDEELSSCGTSRKILRKFRVLDCCTNEIRNGIQVITIMDDQAPKILMGIGQELPDTMNAVNLQGNLNCTGTVDFPSVVAVDSCGSNPLSYRITTPFGQITTNGGQLNATFPLQAGAPFDAIYEVRDACGNVAQDTIVITREDTQPPVAICDEITTVSLSTPMTTIPALVFDNGMNGNIASYDNCGIDSFTVRRMGDIVWLNELTVTCDDVADTVLVEFRVTDFDGNSNICMVQLIVEDKSPASVDTLPTLTFRCNRNPIDTFFSGVPTVNEVCAGSYTLDTITNDTSMLVCRTGVVKRKFIFTNAAGDMIMTTQMINYVDSGIVNIPSSLPDLTVACPVNFDSLFTPTFNTDCDVYVAGDPPGIIKRPIDCRTTEFTITYTYGQPCGNGPTFLVTRKVTQIDNEGPVWDQAPGELDATFACELPTTRPRPTATDNCNGAIVTAVDSTSVSAGNPGCPDVTNTYTYMVSDSCGNENPTPYIQVIRLKDEEAPTFGTIVDFTANCRSEIRDTLPLFLVVQSGLMDNCPGNINLIISSNLADTADICTGSIIRTYTATDACGNSTITQQTISYDQTNQPLLLDTLTPVAGLECYSDVTNYPDPEFSRLGSSLCGSELVITNKTVDLPGRSCPDTVFRTFTVRDDCGNVGAVSQRFIYDDSTDPVLPAIVSFEVTCSTDIPAPDTLGVSLSVIENCAIVSTISTDSRDSINPCAGTVIRTYTARDVCGNTGTVSQTITWNGEGELALIPLLNDTRTYDCYEDILAVDTIMNADTFGIGICGSVLRIDSVTHSENNNCVGFVRRTYHISDLCLNRDSVRQLFRFNDTLPPVFDPIDPIMVDCAASIPEPDPISVTATDGCSNSTVTITVVQPDTIVSVGTCSGSLIRTYIADDGCGNTSTAQQVISYDQTNLTIELMPLDTVHLQCRSEIVGYPFPTSFSAINGTSCGDSLIGNVITTTIDGDPCEGEARRTFEVSDGCGNLASVVQVFKYNDTIPPLIEGTIPPLVIVTCRDSIPTVTESLSPLTITDSCTIIPVLTVDTLVNSDELCAGSITRTYTFSDSCGNAVVLMQEFRWDGSAPLNLDTLAFDPTVFQCYQDILNVDTIVDASIFGVGACGSALQLVGDPFHTDDPGCDSNIVLRGYSVRDACGNSASVVQEFILNDTTGPVFSGVMDLIIPCRGDLPSDTTTSRNISAYDSCVMDTVAFTVTTVANMTNDSCAGSFIRTYEAVDECGNTSSATQTISYGGQPLMLDSLPDFPDTFLCYQDVIDFHPSVHASDFGIGACGTALVLIDSTNSLVDPGCFGEVIRTFTLRDGCMNTGTATQRFIVKDTVGPKLSPNPIRGSNRSCGRVVDNVRASFTTLSTDLCNNDPTTYIFTNNAPNTANPNSLEASGYYSPGTTEITYTASDICGNIDTVIGIVRLVDRSDPTPTCNTITLPLDANGEASVTPQQAEGYVMATDNCHPNSDGFFLTPISVPTETFNCNYIDSFDVEYSFMVQDTFGNIGTCIGEIAIIDPPKIECRNLEYSLRPSETSITITLAEVLNFFPPTDICTPYDSLIIQSSFPVTYSCSQLGTNSPDSFLQSITVIDTDLEETTCEFYIIISHSCNTPPMDPFSLAGRVDAPLYGGTMDSTLVTVDYSGGSVETYSDEDGYYNFVEIPPGAIDVSAKLPMHPAARVTTYDLLRVGQHLLGVQPLDDPLLLLAADVNKSGGISAFDLTAIRRVILGQDPAFDGEHEAATVGAYHPFSDEGAPWADANNWGTHFPYVSENMMSNDISVVKLGDINPDAFLRPRGASQLVLEDSYVKAGETVEILVRNDYQSAIAGLQLAIIANGQLTVDAADENIDLHANHVNGAIRMSIIQEMLQGEPIMSWTFTPNASGMLSELIEISDDIPNESYLVENNQPSQLALLWNSTNVEGSTAEISAFPNPFDNHLSISAHLTKEGKHVLRVLDMTGRSFAVRRIEVTQDSWHNLRLDTEEWSSGVYILSLEGPTGRLTQRVVLQR